MKTVAVVIFAFCFAALSSGSKKPKRCYSNADCKAGQCCSARNKPEKYRYCVKSESPLYNTCPEPVVPECKTSADCAPDECCVIVECDESEGKGKRDAKQHKGTCQKLGALGDSCLTSACPCGQNLTCSANGNCTEIDIYPA